MFINKYRLCIVVAFLSIFVAKMLISVAPVYISIDKNTVKSVILQLEQEHSSESDAGQDLLKWVDNKHFDHRSGYSYVALIQYYGVRNSYIDHYKRYVDPYHPSVPTPPPNLA